MDRERSHNVSSELPILCGELDLPVSKQRFDGLLTNLDRDTSGVWWRSSSTTMSAGRLTLICRYLRSRTGESPSIPPLSQVLPAGAVQSFRVSMARASSPIAGEIPGHERS